MLFNMQDQSYLKVFNKVSDLLFVLFKVGAFQQKLEEFFNLLFGNKGKSREFPA